MYKRINTVMTETAPQAAEPQAVTQDEVVDKAAGYIKKIPKILFWGAVFFVTMIPAGLVLGGIGGVAAAGALGAGAILKTGAALLGVAAGGVGGFFGAQWAFKEKVGDLALNLGLDASEMTLRSLRRVLKQSKDNNGGAKNAPTTAALENAATSAHKFTVKLKGWFGDEAEKKPEAVEVVPAATVTARPVQPTA